MKTIIMIEDKRTQLVLQPESEHDGEVLKMLSKLPNTYRDNFFNCQGGWTRHNEGHEDLVIVFDEIKN